MIAPNTEIYLLNVPIEQDQKNQMDFANVIAQTNYFASKSRFAYTAGDFTYQRADNTVRVPKEYDELQDINYVMYRNTTYNTKWFYAFVTRKEYINANMTALHIKTDVFQSWQFEMELKDSFVAREHVADDTPFAHTLPEPTPSFEQRCDVLAYKHWNSQTPTQFNNDYYVGAYATASTDSQHPTTTPINPVTTVDYCGNVPTPGYLYVCLSEHANDMFNALISNNYTIDFTTAIPKDAVATISTNVANIYVGMDKTETSNWSGDTAVSISSISVSSITYGNTTYNIKNKKVNCYPYMYIEMHDLCGQSVILKPEDMSGTTFYLHSESGATPSYTLYYPTYENETSFKNSISINSFPAIPYAVDYYSQYLALHKNSVEYEKIENNYNTAKSLIFGIEDIANGDSIGGGTRIINDQMRRLQRNAMYSDMKSRPPITHNAPTGNAKFGMNAIGYHINRWYPKLEYIKILDDYFDMFGYNVSTVKTPQYTSRQYWNYLETVNVNIEGNIPQDDMNELKQIFNDGITIWHGNSASNTNWCNYSNNNTI